MGALQGFVGSPIQHQDLEKHNDNTQIPNQQQKGNKRCNCKQPEVNNVVNQSSIYPLQMLPFRDPQVYMQSMLAQSYIVFRHVVLSDRQCAWIT